MIDEFEKHLEKMKVTSPDLLDLLDDVEIINLLKKTYAAGYFLCLEEEGKK